MGGNIKDVETGKGRRIDFVVLQKNPDNTTYRVVDPIEVTSMTADKTQQIAKEAGIRAMCTAYIKTPNGQLIKLDVDTRILRVA